MKALLAAIFSTLLLIATGTVPAQELQKPLLLVAKPMLRGPYSHTALLVVPMGDKHIGFILNRSTGRAMAQVFPEHPPSKNVVDPIYFGGPEASDALFALVRRNPGEAALHLFDDLYMTANGRSIDRIIEETPNEARYFAGFVGWMPRELASEIERGFWYVAEPDAAEVFRKDAGEAMWEDLARRLGKDAKPPRRPGQREARSPGARPIS
ncbi:MAG TPA: YqgE/AlgH family protein [Burkholderiales bacterium]|nr:YqgE/AlgH family protein [Burkholderiales bacterium]